MIPVASILFGVLLTLLGLASYFMSESRSVTALIPTFVGLPLVILGLIARAGPAARKHAMHLAAALGLLGFLAAFGRFVAVGKPPTTLGPFSLLAMAILCGLFVALCVYSFIQARRARLAAGH